MAITVYHYIVVAAHLAIIMTSRLSPLVTVAMMIMIMKMTLVVMMKNFSLGLQISKIKS